MPHSISERKGESVNGSQAKQTESRWRIELPAWCPGAPRDGLWAVFIREESGEQAPHPHPLSLPPRGLPCLLAALLPDSRSHYSLQGLPCVPGTLQSHNMARLCEQRPQPRHLYHLQRGVPQSLPQDPVLLREEKRPHSLYPLSDARQVGPLPTRVCLK